MRSHVLSKLICALSAAPLVLVALTAHGHAQGRALGPDPRDVYEGHLDYAATAGSLLDCQDGTCAGSGNNCVGLDTGSAVLDTLPETPGLRVAYAQLTWVASLPQRQAPDARVTLTPPGGAAIAAVADADRSEVFNDSADAQTCQLIPLLCGADTFNCDFTFASQVADVTAAVEAHRSAGGALNGTWAIGDVTVPGASDADPDTALSAVGSIVIGGWSLLIVYEDEATLPLRKLYYYQGFELISGGERRLRPRGFLAPPDPTVDLTFFALEGDSGTQGDSLSVNGFEVQDACNPGRNVFNDTVNAGRADGRCQQGVRGVDLDAFRLRDTLNAGDETADVLITLPRGDGLLTAGEQVFTNWLMMAFDHIPPNFESLKPEKSAQPPSRSVVQPGDPIDYLIVVENTGGDFATRVVVTDTVPAGTRYVAGSTVVDNVAIADLPGGVLPLAGGLELTALPGIDVVAPGDRHIVRFRVLVNADATEGSVITNIASISADGISPVQTDPVVHPVGFVPDSGLDPVEPVDAGPAVDDRGRPLDAGRDLDAQRPIEADSATPRDDAGALCREGQVAVDGQCVTAPDAAAPGEDLCGPGLRLGDAGRCELLCLEGTLWDPNCGAAGQCRAENAPACASPAASGCGCTVAADGRGAVLWVGLLACVGIGRRRRAR